MGKKGSTTLGLLIAGAVIAAIALGYGYRIAHSPFKPELSAEEHSRILVIERGQTPRQTAELLEKEGMISSASLLIWIGRITGDWSKKKAGEYAFSPSLSPIQILDILTKGVSVGFLFTLREGQNLYELAADLERKGRAQASELIRLAKDPNMMKQLGMTEPLPPSLEGYLFPETYSFPRTAKPAEILKGMVQMFRKNWGEAEAARAAELGLSMHQVITLASIIEKETGAPEERGVISGVFHNRLKKRMRLQSDPTTIYGVWESYSGNITRAHLTTPTPYNTYTIPGLPIGPIANPGREAIKAALYPETTEALFFVSRNDGTHVFTSTYEEHSKAVRELQLNPKAREGKSWRDLQKRERPSPAPGR